MRVLFLSCVFPQPYEPTRGVFCANLCRAIAQEHELVVVAPRQWTDQLANWNCAASSSTRAEPWVTHRPLYFYPPKMFRWTYDWWMWQSLRPLLPRLLVDFAPECILSYWAHPDGAAAVRAGRAAGVPVGIIVGGSDVLLLPREPHRRTRVTQALQAAQAVFTVSDDLRHKTIALGVAPERTHLIRQGVDSELFYPGDRGAARARLGLAADVPTLTWVGKMLPVKGLEFLLQACALLHQRGEPFHLDLIGDGPLRRSLEGQCEQLGLGAVVSFRGAKLPGDLPDWYRSADVTVLSSWSEGLPNVLRESLACGTPFVATRVGGIDEIADPATDTLVPPGDPAALAAALADALRRRPVVEAARTRFDSWASHAQAMLAILRPDLASASLHASVP